jgi:hypothetical protein
MRWIRSIRIPPRPSLLADLQRELASAEPAPAAIGRLIADVGMSGALLKLANSPFYGGARKANSTARPSFSSASTGRGADDRPAGAQRLPAAAPR